MWGGRRTRNFGLWLMVGGWQLTEWCCCSDTPGCGEDQTAGPEDAVLQRYLCGDWHPQAVLGWGWQQWGRRVPCAPLSQFRAGWKLGVLQGTAPSSSPRCWCLCCVTTPHLLANPPPRALCDPMLGAGTQDSGPTRVAHPQCHRSACPCCVSAWLVRSVPQGSQHATCEYVGVKDPPGSSLLLCWCHLQGHPGPEPFPCLVPLSVLMVPGCCWWGRMLAGNGESPCCLPQPCCDARARGFSAVLGDVMVWRQAEGCVQAGVGLAVTLSRLPLSQGSVSSTAMGSWIICTSVRMATAALPGTRPPPASTARW